MGVFLSLVLRRSLASRGMLAIVTLGVLVAAVLLASAPIYARTMADLGLTFNIRDELGEQPNVRVEFDSIALGTEEGRALRSAVEARIAERAGWFVGSRSLQTNIGWFFLLKPGEQPPRYLPLAQPISIQGFEGEVLVTSGRLPQARPPGQPMEVLLTERAAARAGVKVGQALNFREAFDTCERPFPAEDPPPPPPPCNATATLSFTFDAVVVGIYEPADAQSSFWAPSASRIFEPYTIPIEEYGPIIPMLIAEGAVESFATLHPDYRASYSWNLFVDPALLNRNNFERTRTDIRGMFDDFEPYNGYAFSPLTTVLENFGQSSTFRQAPIAILLLEITGIALFYVGIVSAIVVEREAAEISLLRSRGANLRQVTQLYLGQGLLLGVPVLLVAPFLAAVIIASLGFTPLFGDVSNGTFLPVTIPWFSFAMAALGVGLSLAALVVPAVVVALRGVGANRRAESRPLASVIQRYYLDLVLAGCALLLLFELRQRESVFTPAESGGITSDPLLLASPALTIVAAAALILRFYPLTLRVIARVTSGRAGPSETLGLWQVVRNSARYSRLLLLLMMAVAVGTFAASYTTTTNRSYEDRASYESGADIRAHSAISPVSRSSQREWINLLSKVDGIEKASPVYRTAASVSTAGASFSSFQLLGLEPQDAASMLWFREDFADVSLPRLMEKLSSPAIEQGKPIPGQPTSLSAWVRGDGNLTGMTAWVRLRDAENRYMLFELGPAATGGQWQEYTADIREGPFGKPTFPLRLVSVLFTQGVSGISGSNIAASFDDITVADAAGNRTVVEDFETASQWSVFPSRTEAQDEFQLSAQGAKNGRQYGRFVFRPGPTQTETRGMYISSPVTPLPAVASESFAAAFGGRGATVLLRVNDFLVPIVVTETFRLFPTTVARESPVVIVNRQQLVLWSEISDFSTGPYLESNEVLLNVSPGADLDALRATLRAAPFVLDRFVSRDVTLNRNASNPLIAAGGSGILFVAFISVLGLVAVALVASLVTAVRKRRVEFAVIRALGFSRLQLLRMLVLEYALVLVAGVVAGALLGLFVGRQMLSFLEVDERGERLEPAFILQTDWLLVAAGVAAVLLTFAAGLLVAVRIAAQAANAAALRTE